MNEKELYALLTELQTKPHRLVINIRKISVQS